MAALAHVSRPTVVDFEAGLERLGVRHLSLFGSMARGEAGPESDVDVMVELDPDDTITLFDYAGIGGAIEDIVGSPVDRLGGIKRTNGAISQKTQTVA